MSKYKRHYNEGILNPNAKLTNEQVEAAIAEVMAGATQTAIARKYGISQSHLSRIIKGQRRG